MAHSWVLPSSAPTPCRIHALLQSWALGGPLVHVGSSCHLPGDQGPTAASQPPSRGFRGCSPSLSQDTRGTVGLAILGEGHLWSLTMFKGSDPLPPAPSRKCEMAATDEPHFLTPWASVAGAGRVWAAATPRAVPRAHSAAGSRAPDSREQEKRGQVLGNGGSCSCGKCRGPLSGLAGTTTSPPRDHKRVPPSLCYAGGICQPIVGRVSWCHPWTHRASLRAPA